MALADWIHFGPKALTDGLLPTTTQLAARIFVPGGENSTSEPERGPSLTFPTLWGSEKSGTYSCRKVLQISLKCHPPRAACQSTKNALL